uniref:Peptidase M12A domain-containing protein n=1 Tax=Meloidogyne floridensis TaxID=298350 RepID=A0A915NXA7_9BILA
MRRLLPPNIIESLSKEKNIKEVETLEKEEIEVETDEQLQQIPTRHIAIKQRHNNRWVDNEIPFLFSPKFSERQLSIGCFSFVGKVGGRQLLSLAAGCLNDYIIWHEVMHALVNFDKIKLTDVDIYHTYDYHSLMHYDGTAFGRIDKRNRKPMMTMRPKRDGIVLRDNLELTDLDIEKLQILSGCDSTKS